MTDQIKVSDVSAILREQLEGINTTIQMCIRDRLRTCTGFPITNGQRKPNRYTIIR